MPTYRPNVDARITVSESMSIAQLGDDCNGIQTRVFCEGGRNDFQCVCICLEAVRFHAFQRLGVLGKEARNVNLR